MERRCPFPTKYTRFYVRLRREQRPLFPTETIVFFYTYIVPLAHGSGKIPDLREKGYCWVSRFPIQPNLRANKEKSKMKPKGLQYWLT